MKPRHALAGACLLAIIAGVAQLANAGPAQAAPPAAATPLYWQDPDGSPDFSPVPKKTSDGRDYLPVYDDQAEAAPPAPAPAGAGRGKILYYRNPMGLPDRSPVPKKDGMGMDYVPVYENDAADAASGIVSVTPGRLQMLGVRTAAVESRAAPARTVHASGTLKFNERSLSVVVSRTEGWVESLDVAASGETVTKGQKLAEIYSPELAATEREYVVGGLGAASLDRLRAMGAPADEIARLRRTGRPVRSIAIRSPSAGAVIEKMVTAGMKVGPDQPLYRIADLSTLWLVAQVQERDLGAVAPGGKARATMTAYPGRTFEGTVALIEPGLSAETRTAGVRIVLPNPDGALRAGMYASVDIDAAPDVAPAAALVVPESAVLDDGIRQVVLVARGEGKFEPRTVHIGTRGDGQAQILDGLRAGERVVVGANFLIDSESNLRAALKGFSAGSADHDGNARP